VSRGPLLLILLSAIPIGAGIMRLRALIVGEAITPDNARFFTAPLPIVLHVVAVSLYALLGAFQFAPSFRRQHPDWHRFVGWLLVPSAIVAVTAGLWMEMFYDRPGPDNPALTVLRWLFGSANLVCLALGVIAIVRRDFVGHGAWMLRGYAIAVGAGTQSFLLVPWVVWSGPPPARVEAFLMGAGWLFNLVVAERILRRTRERSMARATPHFGA
jgi:hypothetical protein